MITEKVPKSCKRRVRVRRTISRALIKSMFQEILEPRNLLIQKLYKQSELSKIVFFHSFSHFSAILKVKMIGNFTAPSCFEFWIGFYFFPTHRIDFESLSYSTRFWLYQYITCVVAVFWCWCCQNTVGLELLARNVGLEQHPTSHRKTGNESKKSFFQNRHFFWRFLHLL